MALSLGAQGDDYLQPHEWLVGVSYRFLNSYHDFHYSQEVFSTPDIYANTHVHSIDVNVSYALTKRLSLTLEIPFQIASRETYVEHDGITLHTMRSSGLGDLRLSSTFWLLDPDRALQQNLSLSLGIKAPTGDSRATGYSYRSSGPVLRPVDPAIQLGDGGWGMVLGIQGFKKLLKQSSFYFQGSYLINPREMNGTQTVIGDLPAFTQGDIGYTINSVPDQYLGRLGFTQTIWPSQGLSVSLGTRIDGIPTWDLIGGSEGNRVPGYAIYLEPGISVARGKNFFSVTAPIAVERRSLKSVADRRTGYPGVPLAAFADYLITASYSFRF